MAASRNRSRTFVALFAVAALAQFAILLAAPVRPFVDGFSGHLASVSARLIGAFGGTCIQRAAILSNPARGFALEVRDGCNGVNVVILLWAAIVAYPSNWKWKLIGLGAGLAAIQALNLLRLISLFYLGQYSMPVFEFAHLYLWETLIVIDAMVVFGIWSRRAQQ
ncbi:MAG TPA: exosortase H [Bryobacteraceae bacterium]|nr:exosortase H [Bryobacteraceae bacterium]